MSSHLKNYLNKTLNQKIKKEDIVPPGMGLKRVGSKMANKVAKVAKDKLKIKYTSVNPTSLRDLPNDKRDFKSFLRSLPK